MKRYQFSRARFRERVHLLKPGVTVYPPLYDDDPGGESRDSWCGRSCEVGREFLEDYPHVYVPEPHADLVTCIACLVALKEAGQVEIEVVP